MASVAPPLRILIVDDDRLMTDLLPKKLLRAVARPPMEVYTASTPEEGIRLAIERRPDVVLSDFNLRSALDGLDVLDAVRDRHPGAARILFSGHSRAEVGARLDASALDGFLEKPLRLDDLVAALMGMISQATGIRLEGGGAS